MLAKIIGNKKQWRGYTQIGHRTIGNIIVYVDIVTENQVIRRKQDWGHHKKKPRRQINKEEKRLQGKSNMDDKRQAGNQ